MGISAKRLAEISGLRYKNIVAFESGRADHTKYIEAYLKAIKGIENKAFFLITVFTW